MAGARARGGAAEGAKAQAEAAKGLLAARPSGQKEALEKAYSDVFSGGGPQDGGPGQNPPPGPDTKGQPAPPFSPPPPPAGK